MAQGWRGWGPALLLVWLGLGVADALRIWLGLPSALQQPIMAAGWLVVLGLVVAAWGWLGGRLFGWLKPPEPPIERPRAWRASPRGRGSAV